MPDTFIAPSGAKVVINSASFDAALTLKDAIEREAAEHLHKGLIAAFLYADSSPAVNAALWLCLARCTYNDQKITKQTFDPREARADYYEIIKRCGEENLRPLEEGLRSLLSGFGLLKNREAIKGDQKSESITKEAS